MYSYLKSLFSVPSVPNLAYCRLYLVCDGFLVCLRCAECVPRTWNIITIWSCGATMHI